MTNKFDEEGRRERLLRTREQEMVRVAFGRVGPLANTFSSKVVGVTFVAGYPDNLLELERLSLDSALLGDEPLAALIVRNPQNRFDGNACEVHVPALGDDGMIGHLPRAVAARLAPQIDAGETWQAEVYVVRVDPNHLDKPGIDIRLWRTS